MEDPIIISIEDLPDLDTPVAIAGTVHRPEVGGGACFSIVVGVAIYVAT